jgi:hypothetical protein
MTKIISDNWLLFFTTTSYPFILPFFVKVKMLLCIEQMYWSRLGGELSPSASKKI